MTDDIVTRLRDRLEESFCHCVEDPFFVCSYCAIEEAADEIERLRALLVHGLTEGYDCENCDLCEQLKAIHKEAVKNGL